MKLSDYLKAHGISHTDFASRIRVSQPTVTRYANGLRVPTPKIMVRIAEQTKRQVMANDFMIVAEAAE